MKKLVAILLVLAMVFLMVACGGDPTSTQDNSTQPSQNEPDSNKGNEQKPTSTEPAPTEPTTPTNNEISFTEVVVVDNDQCVIKITSVEDDRVFGFTLKAFFENKSSDKTYMFSVESAAINGVQCDPFFATEVAAGKKSNESIIFYGDELKDYAVGDYTDIELTFRVYDTNDWLAEDVARETIHIYPYGQDKATNFVRESKPTDNVLIDNEYVTVIVTAYEEDSIWGYTVNLFLVNKTDTKVMFSVEEASVNGFMADPFYAESVIAGKCAFSSITWYSTTLEENGITDVEELEFRLRVYDYDSWLTEDFANEKITLIP